MICPFLPHEERAFGPPYIRQCEKENCALWDSTHGHSTKGQCVFKSIADLLHDINK